VTVSPSVARSVWRPAAVTAALVLVVLAVQAFSPRDFFTGTNNAGSTGPVATVAAGQRLCLTGLLPAGTGRIQIRGRAGPGPLPVFLATARTPSRTLVSPATATLHGTEARVDLPIPRQPDEPAAVPVGLCFEPTRGDLQVLGRPGTRPGQPTPTLDGAPLGVRVALWYRPPAGERSSLAGQFGRVIDRAALFRPGVVGPWTYVLVGLIFLPAAGLLGIRRLAHAATGASRRSDVLVVGLIAFVCAAAWALVEPVFNAPDESDHFAYVQSIAERGRSPDTEAGRRPIYSSEEAAAIDGAQLAGQYGQRDGRPPWLAADEDRWERLRRELRGSAGDGGGRSTVAPYSPLYYALVAPAYLAASSQSIWSQLTLLRLASALLGALAAGCVFLLVRELLPRHPWAAVGAGLLVAFQPMFAFVSGVVNNDAAVNAAAAALLFLLVRAGRRGLTVRRAAAIGAVLAVLPFAKGSGFFLYPAAAVALGAALWQAHRRGGLRALQRPLAALVVGFAVAAGACGGLAGALGHSPLPTRSGSLAATPAPGQDPFPPVPGPAGNSPVRAIEQPRAFLSYTWQLFLPRLPFMTDLKPAGQSFPAFQIYVERAWASFGLVTVQFARWVYALILAVMIAVAVLALWAYRRAPAAVRDRRIELVVLAAALLCVVLGVEAVYFRETGGGGPPSEQGRYLLPVIAAPAVVAVGASFAFGRRAVSALTVAVVAMMGLQLSALALALTAFYL